MTDNKENSMAMENLNEEQNSRADALLVARNNLTGNGAFGSKGELPERFDVADLIDVAEWVLTGKHPLADYGTEEEAPDGVQVLGPFTLTNMPEDLRHLIAGMFADPEEEPMRLNDDGPDFDGDDQ